MSMKLLKPLVAFVLAGASVTALAQELPLSGAAYRVAEQAYAAYARGDYAEAARQAREAVRLRPDVQRLHDLLAQSQARASGRGASNAPRTPGRATAAGTPRQAARRQAAAAAPVTQTPFEKGYPLATEAYASYYRGEMALAEQQAEQAFRIDPTQGTWAMLWVDSLEAQGKPDTALQALQTAVDLGAQNITDLEARKLRIKRAQAVAPAQAGYAAMMAFRPADAVAPAREAVALAPESASHRLLLISALMLDDQLEDAVQAATDALVQDSEDINALVLRGYLLQRLGRDAGANADFDRALAQDWLDEQQLHNIRLLAVDAALAAGDAERAGVLLGPMDANDEAVISRRTASRKRSLARELDATHFPAPLQACRDTPYGTQCEMRPADQTLDTPAARAYAAYGRQQWAEAITQAQAAVQAAPDDPAMQRLLTSTLAAGNAGQRAQAVQRLNTGLQKEPDNVDMLMQRANLHQRAGEAGLGLADLEAAAATGKAPPTIELDQAYARIGMGERGQASQQIRKSLERSERGELALTPEQRRYARSSLTELERRWGITASVGWRGARQTTATLGGAALSTPGDAAFSSVEAYWRPIAYQPNVELYARLTNVLYDGGGKYEALRNIDPCTGEDIGGLDDTRNGMTTRTATGWPSSIAALGARFRVPDTGLGFGIERRQFIGSANRHGGLYAQTAAEQCRLSATVGSGEAVQGRYQLDDAAGGWMTYVSYGWYHGAASSPDDRSWPSMQLYAQGGYAWSNNDADFRVGRVDFNGTQVQEVRSSGQLKRSQLFASSEFRFGWSYRPRTASDNWTINPFAVVGADWYRQRDRAEGVVYPDGSRQSFRLAAEDGDLALGAGVGIGVRRLFREDRLHGPRSSFDASVQYRFALNGDQAERNRGLFINMTLSY
ncbi:hypothetical protein [uncultured Stenotrophomonas sp.]|uniref:NfrA family protein n=1 Tax=uncultured Stenotrophomonas sp. TaxID=165438 RepID=UPI0025CBA2BC|nr:hypothetical protein [uncultured Stenotrophomonas sp.]